MKIGLISDTHNHLPETRRALDLLLQKGAGHLVHCGDVGEDVLDLLSATCMEQGIRAHVAIGNCDAHADERFLPQPSGIERGSQLEFQFEGKRCVALHGHRAHQLAQVLDSGRFDYVFTGHTHRATDQRIDATRLLNPGSPVRPRGGKPGVAVLDLATDSIEWLLV